MWWLVVPLAAIGGALALALRGRRPASGVSDPGATSWDVGSILSPFTWGIPSNTVASGGGLIPQLGGADMTPTVGPGFTAAAAATTPSIDYSAPLTQPGDPGGGGDGGSDGGPSE